MNERWDNYKNERTWNYTLLLDEATDESNRSKLFLITRVVESAEVHDHFLSLLEIHRCDAESIFKTVRAFLIRKNVEITNVGFSGMDGCSTMAGFIMVFDLILSNVHDTYFTSTAAT